MKEKVIRKGTLTDNLTTEEKPYVVVTPVATSKAKDCDESWLKHIISEAIALSGGDSNSAAKILDEIHFSNLYSHWSWERKANFSISAPKSDGYCYETFACLIDEEIQALMIIRYPKKSRLVAGTNLIYIDFLQVAPWNVKNKYRDSKRFSGLGVIMIAVALSFKDELAEEYGAGLGLHSLGTSEEFYRRAGFVEFEPDPSHQNLVYFELPSENEPGWRA